MRDRRDRGVVAVVTAILMLAMFGLLAFAVDAGHWYSMKQKVQRAADAAALAGVVDLPSNVTGATTLAQQYAVLNGFRSDEVAVIPELGASNRLTVTITTQVSNWFAPVLGIDTTTISATSTADYVGPVRMGSPCNRLGTDPETAADPTAPDCATRSGRLWLNVNAPQTAKANGDPYQSLACAGGEDGCDGLVNTDYREGGYYYDIIVPPGGGGMLNVQLFDPVWVNVGDSCDGPALDGLATKVSGAGFEDAATRYASGKETGPTDALVPNEYCTGDGLIGDTTSTTAEDTTFTLLGPDGTSDPATRMPVDGCTHKYLGDNPASSDALAATLETGYAKRTAAGKEADVYNGFRRWTTLCSLSVTPGDYILQVQSSGSLGAGNRFSIRTQGVPGVTVGGHESMGLYTNDDRDASSFYLARVPSSSAGQTLKVQFFDIGDCDVTDGSDGCTLTLLAPGATAGAPATPATNCTGEGAKQGSVATCSFPVPTSDFNGKWETVYIPIPRTYTCVDSSPYGCWYKVAFVGKPHDVTAWTASMDQSSVRLLP